MSYFLYLSFSTLVLLAIECRPDVSVGPAGNALLENKPATASQPSTGGNLVPCTCGVFLSGQFKKGCNDPPTGLPALLHEHEAPNACTPIGNKQCTNKCLDSIVRHLPNSPSILCGSIDRDCHKERAYLFIQNCNETWFNTNLSAGREYCCKDGFPYKCPMLS